MDKSRKTFRPELVPPGVVLWLRCVDVEIARIRALADAIGEPKYQLAEECNWQSTSRTIYIAENPDNSYELITDLSTMLPDIVGSPAKQVSAKEIERRPESAASIELLRDYSSRVDANRRSLTDAELLELVLNGGIEDVTRVYLRDKNIDPRGLKAVLTVLGEDRFSHETFYRHKRLLGQESDTNDGKAAHKKRTTQTESKKTKSNPAKQNSDDKSFTDATALETYNGQENQADLFPDLFPTDNSEASS
jgi:hypothetical protein